MRIITSLLFLFSTSLACAGPCNFIFGNYSVVSNDDDLLNISYYAPHNSINISRTGWRERSYVADGNIHYGIDYLGEFTYKAYCEDSSLFVEKKYEDMSSLNMHWVLKNNLLTEHSQLGNGSERILGEYQAL